MGEDLHLYSFAVLLTGFTITESYFGLVEDPSAPNTPGKCLLFKNILIKALVYEVIHPTL